MSYVLPYLILFLLVLEGIGIPYARETTYILVIFLIPILFVHMLFHKKDILFPKRISFLFLIFIASSLLSGIMGINIRNSIEHSFLSISMFLVFLISYNYKVSLRKPLIIIIFIVPIFFILYFLLLTFHINVPIPHHGYQFVFSKFGSHNHLGDFLVLPSIICLYYLYNRKHLLLAISYQLLAIIFIFFSYSRSAYVSIALTMIFLHLKYLKNKRIWPIQLASRTLLVVLILSVVFFIVATTRQAVTQPLSKEVNVTLVKKGGLKHKELLGNRLEYIKQSLLSVQKHPIFGVGPNNFLLVSKEYAPKKSLITEATHNIFLEILVGQGIFGLLPFVGVITMILIKSQKNALFFAFLAMLINFQTDYTYQIYSFLLLFFIIAGTILKDHPKQ